MPLFTQSQLAYTAENMSKNKGDTPAIFNPCAVAHSCAARIFKSFNT